MVLHCLLFVTCILFSPGLSSDEDRDHIASVLEAEETASRRCHYDLHQLWSHEVGHSPFVSTPLITDVDSDGRVDVIAVSFTEAVTVIDGESGKLLSDGYWPVQFTDRSFHASPLQFDMDGDGMLDILLTTSAGELLFYTKSGQLLEEYTFTVPPVYVHRDWFTKVVSISHSSVHDFILDDIPKTQDQVYISVDAHVLATPALTDLNNDDRIEELVVPVSYYYDTEDYRLVERLQTEYNVSEGDVDKYLVSAVVIVNLTSLNILHTVHLDLTQMNSVFPAYLLATPTVIDLDSNGGPSEIIVGTAAGNLHVVESTGKHRDGFPVSTNSLTSPVLVSDLLGNNHLQLLTVDPSGNVACHSHQGELIWESEVSGPVSSAMRLSDIDGNEKVDIVVTTNDGSIHVLSGETGAALEGWPLNLGFSITANVLITRISKLSPSSIDFVLLADDGSLHLVSSDHQCRKHIPVGETSFVQALSYDLSSQSEGSEMLIATKDGTLLCFGRGYKQRWISRENDHYEDLMSSVPTELKTYNDFYYGPKNKTGIVITSPGLGITDISSSSFWLHYNILGSSSLTQEFHVKVYFGRHLLTKTSHSEPGEYYTLVPSWLVPSHGHVTVVLTNRHGQVFQDSIPVRFHRVSLHDLQWLLCGPFLAMSILILILHGFPAKDLLPTTMPAKVR